MAAVVGIVTSVVGPLIELGKLIGPPIKRQFNYLCCFTSNIQSLKDEAKKLEDVRDGLQLKVDEAERKAEVIFPEVKTWLSDANKIHVSFGGIENDIPKVQSGFLKTKSRFSLSKKAKKMSEAMKELQCAGKFDHISQPAPPQAMGSVPIGQVYEFETRKQIEEDIMEALRGGEVNMLGLCGMGGVGKTTMAKRIMNRVREENLFDEILMAVVSQQVDMLKIQSEIAESLGLNLTTKNLSTRAHQLRIRLAGTKRILVVLDDVWERLEMEDLGIPCETGVKGCTVLLTSRDGDVFDAMNVQKVCALQILPEREAWSLFKEKVGSCLDNPDLVSIAEEVAKECKGLPIALVTVGMALKNKKRKSIWKDALQQLKSSNPEDIPHVVPEVYEPLKLSYNYLVKIMPNAKIVFLLCSLFPEDSDISLKKLTSYIMGLGIFEKIMNWENTRKLEKITDKVDALVDELKSRFLLLDGKNEHYVKMHDVIRDVAISVASQERLVDPKFNWSIEHAYSDCKWILMSSREIELPMVLDVPSLRLTLESVSVVGELPSLEILSCRSCDSIAELPEEIGSLTHLRSLEFSYCKNLKRVAPGLISRLVRLEELKMRSSFKGWESDKNDKESRNNASLNELQFLSNLTCLEIEIEDCTLAAEEMRLSPNIVKYYINFTPRYSIQPFEKRISMRWPKDVIILGDWILNLLRKNNEYLELIGDGSDNFDLARVQKMKRFDFRECSTVTKLVSTTSVDWGFGVLPTLESLRLRNPIQAGSNSLRFVFTCVFVGQSKSKNSFEQPFFHSYWEL
ncbi:hypothetical protein BUALT_Bualt12G0012800 [Buddleja alternifolia]|uniref:NB-ARC domain-containing protein n=1 Tax=Buddleja alternifolia TaxID=168488 RepID=A0AAV6WYE3_9LAMI|nr:hypothetical protein BUALT_Bualt12G0012800 [Buddleja alternifolia]